MLNELESEGVQQKNILEYLKIPAPLLDETMDIHKNRQGLDWGPLKRVCGVLPKHQCSFLFQLKSIMSFPNYKSNMFKLEKLENTDRLRQETFNLNNILIFIIPDFFHNRYILSE